VLGSGGRGKRRGWMCVMIGLEGIDSISGNERVGLYDLGKTMDQRFALILFKLQLHW